MADWKIGQRAQWLCDCCERAKAKFESLQSQYGSKVAIRYMKLIGIDLFGPFFPLGAKFGAKWVLIVVCIWSGRVFSRLLKRKTDFRRMLLNIVEHVIGEFKAGLIPRASLPEACVQDNKLEIVRIYADGDGVFRGDDIKVVDEDLRSTQVKNFKLWCQRIFYTLPNNVMISPPYKQSYNAEPERAGGQHVTDVRAMVYASTLKTKFWDSASTLQSMVRPMLGHQGNPNEKSPWQMIYLWIPNYQELKRNFMPFGAIGVAALSEKQQVPGKCADKGLICHYLHPSLRVRRSFTVLIGQKEYDVNMESCKFDCNRLHVGEWWRLRCFRNKYQWIGRHGERIDLESPLREIKASLLPPRPRIRRRNKDASVRIAKADAAARRRREIYDFYSRKNRLRLEGPEIDLKDLRAPASACSHNRCSEESNPMGEPGTTNDIMEESKDIATKQFGPEPPPNHSAAGTPVVPGGAATTQWWQRA